MKQYIVERVTEEALFVCENKATVRDTGKVFNVSKSTVHKDLRDRLPVIDKALYREVAKVLEFNLEERHLRGGEATRKKFKGL